VIQASTYLIKTGVLRCPVTLQIQPTVSDRKDLDPEFLRAAVSSRSCTPYSPGPFHPGSLGPLSKAWCLPLKRIVGDDTDIQGPGCVFTTLHSIRNLGTGPIS